MGTWGHESFANDDAADFVAGLVETDDLALVEDVIAHLLDVSGDYVELPEAAAAIAACEVIARLKGHWGRRDEATQMVDEWVEAHPQRVPGSLAKRAVKALDRILDDDSELRELWEEGEGAEDWKAAVVDLRRRVEG